jgi:hypothetical protein
MYNQSNVMYLFKMQVWICIFFNKIVHMYLENKNLLKIGQHPWFKF